MGESQRVPVEMRGGPPVPYWTVRQVFFATLVVLLVIAAFWALARFSLVVFGVLEAIVFGTALRPAVLWLNQRGLPRWIGAALIFLVVVALLVGMLLLLIPVFTEQGATIANTLTGYYSAARDGLMDSNSLVLRRLVSRLPQTLTFAPSISAPAPAAPATPEDLEEPLNQAVVVFGYLPRLLNTLFLTISVLLLTFYWVIDRDRIVRSLLIFLPVERRDAAREFLEASEQKVSAYLRGLGILCFTIGALSLVAYLMMGLPYAVLLAVIAGLMEAVPLIGPFIGAAPAVLVAVALFPDKIIWVVISTIIIQQLENNLLVPRVMDRSVGVNPVISLLAFVIFSSLFGLGGALLAVPLAATIQLIVSRSVIEAPDTPPLGRTSTSLLRYEAQQLIQDVRKQVRHKDTALDDPSDKIEDSIEAIVNDLDSLLAQTELEEQNGEIK